MASQQALDDKQVVRHIETAATKPHFENVGKTEKIVTTQDSRFAAVNARNKPSPFSKSLLALYPILFVAFMNSAANGFDVRPR